MDALVAVKVGDIHHLLIGSQTIVCMVDSIDGNEVLLVDAQGGVYLITVLPPTPQRRQRPFQDGWKLRARARTPLESRPAGLLPHWGETGTH